MLVHRDIIDEIKHRLPIDEAARALVPGIVLRRAGRELVGLSPFKAERTPSFYVDPRKGVFHCFASGLGGDVVRLAEKVLGCGFADAIAWCADRAGITLARSAVPDDAAADAARRRADERAALAARERSEAAEKLERARAIWARSVPSPGTLVETYLRARRIDCDALRDVYGAAVPASLRFAPKLPYRRDDIRCELPAMVGAVFGPDRRIVGVHRTWLAHDGSAKAPLPKPKLMLGGSWGAAGWLSHPAARAIAGEGYETTLTCMGALARAGIEVFALSAGSLGNIAGAGLGNGRPHPSIRGRFLPSTTPDPARPALVMPAIVDRLTLLEDADGRDPASTRALIDRALIKFRRAGIAVDVASPRLGSDFNDMAKGARA